jgi:xylulokinase
MANSAHIVGLDIGTTGAKALLVGIDGRVIASATAEYPMSTPQPLWAEQNPDDWWIATQRALKELLAKARIPPTHIAGIGLTGQMHGLVLLDASGSVLRPCIMWNDQRTAAECDQIASTVGFDRLLELTCNAVLPGFTAPKILWVRNHEPEVYRKIAHVLLPKDFIRYKLTGEFATDVSDASGTSLFDVRHRRWSVEMLGALDIPHSWLPQVYESPNPTGCVTDTAARLTGILAGTPVIAGAGDQAAGAIGSGIIQPGIVLITIGTSGVVFAHTDSLSVEPRGTLHAFCHAVPGAWHLMGVTLAAGGSLRWFRDALGEQERMIAAERGGDPYDVLSNDASGIPTGSDGLLFLPYLSGERTPHSDPNARGAFIGLTLRHTRAHMVRAVMEGVVFSLRDCLELMKSLGVDVGKVRASGGGARSPLWRQILSDVCNCELVTVPSTEGASYGAALLAGVGTGVFNSVAEACASVIRITATTVPQAGNVARYDQLYRVYRELYPALRPSMTTLATIRT